MKGILILCNRCRKKMDGVCKCGNYKCLVQVYWKGKYPEYRRDSEGDVLTYDKATKKAIEISNAIRAGTFNPDEHKDNVVKERKFDMMIEKWLNEKKAREALNELSPGTTGAYESYVKNHYPFFYGLDVREDGWYDRFLDFKETLSGVKIKTRRNIMNALRNFFNWLKDREIIKEVPRFPVITGDDSKPSNAMSWELQEECLARVPVVECRDVIEFLTETGIRPSEGCALLCEDINVRDKEVSVNKGYKRGNIVKPTTKGKKNLREPLSERALEIAQRHMMDKLPKQFLFINPRTNKGYLPKALWYAWKKYSGQDSMTLYESTRHSFGSQLIQQHDVVQVQELMGHADIRTTRKYLHLRMTELHEVVNSRKNNVNLLNRSVLEVN